MTDRRGPHGTGEPSVPDLLLERSRLGELPVADQDALARRVEVEPDLRPRLEALERSDAELHVRLDAARLAAGVRARLATRRESGSAAPTVASRAWPLPAGLAVAATVALAVYLRTEAPAPNSAGPSAPPAPSSPSAPSAPGAVTPSPTVPHTGPPPRATAVAPSPTEEPGVRIKGLHPALSLFRKTANGSEVLADGDVARAGDLIRIGYRAVGRHYGVIVSLDARGALTRHLPERGRTAAPLEARDIVLLGQAYQLDDAPAWERFFFVTADAPFEVATVEQAARRMAGGRPTTGQAPADLPLPDALEQSTFLLTKERRP